MRIHTFFGEDSDFYLKREKPQTTATINVVPITPKPSENGVIYPEWQTNPQSVASLFSLFEYVYVSQVSKINHSTFPHRIAIGSFSSFFFIISVGCTSILYAEAKYEHWFIISKHDAKSTAKAIAATGTKNTYIEYIELVLSVRLQIKFVSVSD